MDALTTGRRRARARLALALVLAIACVPRAAGAQDEHEGHDASAMAGFSPQLTLHGFSDVTLGIAHTRFAAGSDTTTSAFALGQFDLFLVSRLSDRFSFLGESVFEVEPDGETGVDVERVFIKYTWSDLLRLSAGRTRTALGYWNEVFHHGSLLQPTVERPEALKFEDAGGILPVHSVGLELAGRMHSGVWDLDYVGNVADGRGANSEQVQGSADLNSDKALGLKLSLIHGGGRSVAIGPSIYRDRIPPDPLTPGREGSISERIAGAHFNLVQRPVEVIAEYYHVRHQDRRTGAVRRHDAGYVLAAVRHGRWKPYAAVDRLAFAEGDLFYVSGQRDLTRAIAGVRFETGPFNAVKMGYRHDRRPGETSNALLVQTAFTF